MGGAELSRGHSVYRVGDRVLQAVNDYTKEVFNGDLVRKKNASRARRRDANAIPRLC